MLYAGTNLGRAVVRGRDLRSVLAVERTEYVGCYRQVKDTNSATRIRPYRCVRVCCTPVLLGF